MCGIAGTTISNKIQHLLRLVAHRGPDSQVIKETISGFNLGFARLAITGKGRKATILEQDGDWLLFNGEIFGYPAEEYETDTQYLFHVLKNWRSRTNRDFPFIHGQYAFAFWDSGVNKLILGRDFFGERPLYYCQQTTDFSFASEVKALLPVLDSPKACYSDVLSFLETEVLDTEGIVPFSQVNHSSSMVQGIYQVPPNTFLVFSKVGNIFSKPTRICVHPKWHLTANTFPKLSVSDMLYNSIIERADHGNKEIGAYLSGGLDSALICCVARPKHVFTCVFDTPIGRREYELASMVAKRIGAVHHIVKPEITREAVARTVYALDGPQATMSPVASFALAKEAAKYVKVVLTGQGADELFCGYFRDLLFYNDMTLRTRYRRYNPLMDYYHGGTAVGQGEQFPRQIWAESFLHLLARGEISANIRNYAHTLSACSASPLEFAIKMEIAFTLPSLVQLDDRAAAHAGIESRSPFLDDELYQAAIGMTDEQRIAFVDGRWITKRALRDIARGIVPDDIIDCEEKTGLHVPLEHLFTNKPSLRGTYSRTGYAEFCQNTWRDIVENTNHEATNV